MADSKTVFVKDLKKQTSVHNCFVLISKDVRVAKNGKKYIEMTIGDKTGTLTARRFGDMKDTKDGANLETQELFSRLEVGSVYEFHGKVEEFPKGSGQYNMIVRKLKPTKNYNIEDFQPEAQTNRKLNIKYIKDQASYIKTESLKKLVCCFIESEYWESFIEQPAAMTHHHNYNSGLIEHTVNVMKTCSLMNHCYSDLDKDLLLTGALLHDIGKIKTYSLDKTMVTMTPEGEQYGHLYLSSKIADELFIKYHALNSEPLPEDQQKSIQHMILSHHGPVSNGWGSVVDPNTPEAVTLHYADLLDSRAKGKLQEQF